MTVIKSYAMARAITETLELAIWLVGSNERILFSNSFAERLVPKAESLTDLAGHMVGVPMREYVEQVRAGGKVVDPLAVLRTTGGDERVELRLSRGPAPLDGTLLLTMGEIRWRMRPEWVRALREMSSALNHGINNPLAILSAEIELMSGTAGASPRQIERMRSSVRRVGDVLVRLREVAEAMGAAQAPRPRSNPSEKAA